MKILLSSHRKKAVRVPVLVVAVLCLSRCGDDLVSPLLSQLRDAPTEITVAGVTLELGAALGRDFMPSTHPDSRLVASVWVEASAWPLPQEVSIVTVWVVLRDSVWATVVGEEDRRSPVEATVRGGPAWPVGALADVVVQLVAADGEEFLLAARRREIEAGY
jgi:hypothetical protein